MRWLLFLCLPDVTTIVKDNEKCVVSACESVKRLSAEVQLQELILDGLLDIARDDSVELTENNSFSPPEIFHFGFRLGHMAALRKPLLVISCY